MAERLAKSKMSEEWDAVAANIQTLMGYATIIIAHLSQLPISILPAINNDNPGMVADSS